MQRFFIFIWSAKQNFLHCQKWRQCSDWNYTRGVTNPSHRWTSVCVFLTQHCCTENEWIQAVVLSCNQLTCCCRAEWPLTCCRCGLCCSKPPWIYTHTHTLQYGQDEKSILLLLDDINITWIKSLSDYFVCAAFFFPPDETKDEFS